MNPDLNAAPSTVFIVDDDPSICEGISNLLESEGMGARHFGSAQEFLQFWSEDMPGCLLLDVRLPGITGVEFQEKLNGLGVSIPIIFMTAHADVPMVRKVMKAGAVEFLTKPFQRDELLTAIHQAFEKDRLRREEQRELQSVRQRYELLSQRERDVMEMATAGLLNKEIANRLELSEITVKVHRRHVMEKMGANTFAELVRLADTIKRSLGC